MSSRVEQKTLDPQWNEHFVFGPDDVDRAIYGGLCALAGVVRGDGKGGQMGGRAAVAVRGTEWGREREGEREGKRLPGCGQCEGCY